MPELVCPACHGCAEVHVQAYDLALRRRGRPGLLPSPAADSGQGIALGADREQRSAGPAHLPRVP